MTIVGIAGHSHAEPPASDDPYLWLEDVSGNESLDWVREQNATAHDALEANAEFERLRSDLLAILDSDAKIPYVEKLGSHYYNFWKDKEHQRGIWRRTTLKEYRKPEPEWETLLDQDALNEAEGENWVWHGAECLKPVDSGQPYERCLIALSRGGADADVTREFDLTTNEWVRNGFFRAEAKGALGWIDRDTVFVFTDFGEGSLTESGYPRIVKEWKRGTPMAEARLVYEGQAEDMYIGAMHDDTQGHERDFVVRYLAFYNDELYLRGTGGELSRVEAPNSANKSVHRDWLFLELREPWVVAGRTWPAGSLLATQFDQFMAGEREFEALFEPTETTSLAGFAWTKNHLLLNVLDNVKNRISVLTPGADGWMRAALAGAPTLGTLSATAVDDEESDDYFLTVTDFLTPTTLYLGSVGRTPEKLKELPAFFDAGGLAISQHFATSKDGTRIPYFLVAREKIEKDGENRTLLYGYGGFEVSLTPSYSASVGRGWLSQGGVYAVANIRGGGEFGPRWHQAALKEERHKAYEDFAAVAEDLIRKKITRPGRLGIQGGSNGGLLVGNMLTRYPRLFGAVVCQVPLLDMQRYHRLLAGASWMAEYGDPDKPEEWAYIRKFSPYHNVRTDVDYPPVLFATSTRDDRVHPGHARKMMARMLEQGHDALYYENIEGGHGGAADNPQQAYMQALAYTFLKQTLMK
jgi:prolyl oligopeptidase